MRKAVLCFLLSAFSVLAQNLDVNARLEQIIQSRVVKHEFMGSVLIAKGDTIVLNRGYGSANLEWSIPNSPSTKFRLGSLTKQFTAACVLLLQERGRWRTSDKVKAYLPDAPATWDNITIAHLLSHTSGIPNFTSFPDYRDTESKTTTPEALVQRFRDKPLDFEPGSKWRYSNSGYILLGYLIEKVSGEAYQRFVQENLFQPLGMGNSGYDSNAAIIPQRASGYAPSKDGVVNAGFINMTVPFSAGALYSTTEDLLKWNRGLYGEKLLSEASLKEMTTAVKQDYGFGLSISVVKGHRRIEHNGGIEGFNTHLSYWPEDKLSVVVLANLNGNAADELAGQLAAAVHGEKVTLASERKEVTLSPSALDQFVGIYSLAPNVELSIIRENDHLMTQLTGQPKFQIYPENSELFFLKVVDAQLEFGRDESGKIVQVTLHQGGRDLVARKR